MARLPIPGGDDGHWGGILNDFLSQVHNPDGTLKNQTVAGSQLVNSTVSSDKLASGTGVNGHVLTFDSTVSGNLAWRPAPTGGSTTSVTMGGDLTGSSSNAQLIAGAVTANELADTAVATSKLMNNAVTTAKLADTAVTATKLATTTAPATGQLLAYDGTGLIWSTPSTASIADGSIAASKLNATGANGQVLVLDSAAPGGFSWQTITTGSATPAGPAGGSLAGTYPNPSIASNAVTTSAIADAQVTTVKLVDSAVTTTKLADDSITSAKIVNGSIQEADLDPAIVAKLNTTDAISDGSINPTALNTNGDTPANGEILSYNSTSQKFEWVAPASYSQVSTDWNATTGIAQILNKPVLSSVATSGSYVDLTNKPAIPTSLNTLTDVNVASVSDGQVLAYDSANNSWVAHSVTSTTVNDATLSAKGIVQLAGDLAGTASSPTVPGLAAKEPIIAAGTVSQYWRGDKTWQALDKAALGLSNVDNTSDAAKPVSTAAQTAIDTKADATTAISGMHSVTGGGDLSASRTLSLVGDAANPGNDRYYGTNSAGTKGFFALPAATTTDLSTSQSSSNVTVVNSSGADAVIGAATTTQAGVLTSNDKTKLDGVATGATANQADSYLLDRANHTGTQTIATVANLQSSLDAKLDDAQLGTANGVASLDGAGKVPASQLPSYVDDVLEFINQAAFPATGSSGIIYVAQDTNKIFRWSGSAYIEIGLATSGDHKYGTDITIGANPASTASADNASAIQARIDAQAALGGGIVYVPAGIWLTGPLRMKTGVVLAGDGWGSILRLKNGSNTDFITLDTIAVEKIGIKNLLLDCNKANQTSGDGIVLNNTGYDNGLAYPSLGDPNHYIFNVMVINAKGHGVRTLGAYSQTHFDRVLVYLSDGNNFRIESPDNHLQQCVSAKSGFDGFHIASNSNRFINCKSWLSGRIDSMSGSGYRVATVSRIDFIGCESQDNRQHGFSLNTTANLMMSGCRVDRNGIGASGTGGVGDGVFLYQVTNSTIDYTSGDNGFGGVTMQRWAYNSGGNNDGNIVNISINNQQDMSQPGVGSFGARSSVRIVFNGKIINEMGNHTGYGTAAPTTGTWIVGDRVLNSTPAASGPSGWVCVTAGAPGTWKVISTIAP